MSNLGSGISREMLLDQVRTPWPQPEHGMTSKRWHLLASLARTDLPLAKLVEPHHDAMAIIAELGGTQVETDQIWAVWAANPPFALLEAERDEVGWRLSGTKAYCSGADLVTHALVTAATRDGDRLFAIELSRNVTVDPSAPVWTGLGMVRARTSTLSFADVAAKPVGPASAYIARSGFWWGAIGIAAAWFGGALGVADLIEAASDHLDPHGLAHLGGIRSELDTMQLTLDAAAYRIDTGSNSVEDAERLALAVRARAAAVVEDVISRVGRALGPTPLAFNPVHAQRVADLQVFVRQHHAERDLARLGSLTCGHG